MASFLLGLAANGSTNVSLQTANASHYSGLYVTDTFQASRNLTLTAGLRWDLPLAYTERYDRIGVFDPGATNPLAQTTGLPLKGAAVYVNSPADPYRSVYNPDHKLFGPTGGISLSSHALHGRAPGIRYRVRTERHQSALHEHCKQCDHDVRSESERRNYAVQHPGRPVSDGSDLGRRPRCGRTPGDNPGADDHCFPCPTSAIPMCSNGTSRSGEISAMAWWRRPAMSGSGERIWPSPATRT